MDFVRVNYWAIAKVKGSEKGLERGTGRCLILHLG
jgi:hypothetical protein